MWFISNLHNTNKKDSIRLESFHFESTSKCFQNHKRNLIIFCEGSFSLRNIKQYGQFKEEIIEALYIKHGLKFAKLLKGNYTIIIIENNSFHVISDLFSVQKFFYWQKGDGFIVSSSLSVITTCTKAMPSYERVAKYALTYHFSGGSTIFSDINHNNPSEILQFSNGKLRSFNYWSPSELLESRSNNVQLTDISSSVESTIKESIKHIGEKLISLSLTGGADTRNLLSVLLKQRINPHIYTYGNPKSADCIKAKAISDTLGLDHTIHNISMTPLIFKEYARKIVKIGNSLASIHRAHRFIAVELERSYATNMFLGTLGGEFIRGVSEDNYIIPSTVYENWTSSELSIQYISNTLIEKGIFLDNIDLLSVKAALSEEPFFNGSPVERKLNSLVYLTAHLHDAQDLNLYMTVMDKVFTPFLDIDYLELVFSSEYSFIEKEKNKNSFLKRISNPIYASKFLESTYPELLKFEYSGEHIPREVLFNKYYAAAAKYVRQKIRPAYPQNFPLGQWMVDFVKQELPTCNDYIMLKDVFDLESLVEQLDHNTHRTDEAYWLKFTNPIMMKYILDEYSN